MDIDLTDPIFTDEEEARKRFEALRWPNGPVCPHCGSVNNATALKGKKPRPGLYRCRGCAKQFTATVGTRYERSHTQDATIAGWVDCKRHADRCY
jgi:transposase-like protein